MGNREQLQQYLPFTVLKRIVFSSLDSIDFRLLQQYLPFTVLKPIRCYSIMKGLKDVATVLTVYGIETRYS